VTFGVIAWRRSTQPTGLDWWRMQLKQMARDPQKTSRKLLASAQKSARKALPQIADVGELATDQLDGWRDMLGDQLDAWRDTVGGPAMVNAKQISKLASKNAAKGMATWAATLAAVAAIASDALDTWRETLSDALDDWRETVGDSLSSNSTSLSKTLGRSANRVTRGPRRVVTRAMLSMRWLRRGLFFGAIGGAILGLLFAPVSGSQLRARISAWMRQMGGQLRATMANAPASLPQRATAGTGMPSATNTPGTVSGAGTTGTTKTTKPTTGSRLSETGPIH
jgi:gas vesicle protein